jgi:hypothetical protein
MDGADTGTDVDHARSDEAFAPNDLDQFSRRGVQLPLAPSGQIGFGELAVVCEEREVLVAAEPTPRVRCHRVMVRCASTAVDVGNWRRAAPRHRGTLSTCRDLVADEAADLAGVIADAQNKFLRHKTQEAAMTTEQLDAMNMVRQAVASAPADRFLERLAELVSARAGVQAVFGEPIRQDNLTVIPVARVRWGFGGGGGRSDGPPSGPASGSGGGGGAAADPIGYLDIRPDGATFRPIRVPFPSPLFLIASGLCRCDRPPRPRPLDPSLTVDCNDGRHSRRRKVDEADLLVGTFQPRWAEAFAPARGQDASGRVPRQVAPAASDSLAGPDHDRYWPYSSHFTR